MTTAPRPPRSPAPNAARSRQAAIEEMNRELARVRQAEKEAKAKEAEATGQLDLLSAAPSQPAPVVTVTPALQPLAVQVVPDLRPSAQPRPAPPALLQPIDQTQKIINKKKPSKSKRETLGQLPPDWRARIFAATGTIDKARPPSQARKAVAVLWLTGCRPLELQNGVEVQMDGGQLVITIRSAKVGEIDNGAVIAQRGIEVRRLRIDPTSTPAAELLAGLAAAGPIVVKHPKKSLRTRVNELGREVLAKMRNPPSVAPYSFRHAMGCDLKSCDTLTDEERAAAMGHLSTESLTKYGRRRRGGGGQSPFEKIEASAVPHGARQPGQVQADSQADTTRPKG